MIGSVRVLGWLEKLARETSLSLTMLVVISVVDFFSGFHFFTILCWVIFVMFRHHLGLYFCGIKTDCLVVGNRSTSPPGGNLVNGLPPVVSYRSSNGAKHYPLQNFVSHPKGQFPGV